MILFIGILGQVPVQAQLNTGKMIIGVSSSFRVSGELSSIGLGSDMMSFGFSSVKYKSNQSGFVEPKPDKHFNLNLMPRYGVFVADQFLAGLDGILAVNRVKYGGYDETMTVTLMAIGPFLRYYYPMGKVLPFAEGNAIFGTSRVKEIYNAQTTDDKYGANSFGGGIGLAVPLGEKVHFDLMAGYTWLSIKAKQDNPNDDREVMGSFGFRVGFNVLLGSPMKMGGAE